MTNYFTLKKWAFKFIVALLGVFALGEANAQTYCTSWSYYGCYYSTTYYAPIERLRIKDVSNNYILDKAADGCNAGITTVVNTVGNGYTLMSNKPQFTLSSGSKYTMESSTSYGSATSSSAVTVYIYVWIDFNRDGNFSSNEYMSTGWGSMIAGLINKGGNLVTNSFTVPCNITPGTSRMRVLASYSYTMDAAQGCKQGTTTSPTYYYGETEDYTITLANPTSLAAGFFMPSTAYVGSAVKLTNANPIGYISHDWDINDDGSIEYKTTNANHIFTTPGTKCIRLKSANCLGRDSVLKCINIVNPTAKPVVDFGAVSNEIERFGTANLLDLSTNGPTYWSWYMYDPKDSAATRLDVETFNPSSLVGANPLVNANPAVFFNKSGSYTVCLQTSNSLGASAVKCKPNFIRVTPPKDNNMGAGTVQPIYEQNGNIMDDGGRTGNYSNNRIDYATIIPCGAKTITLTFAQFKVAAGDELKIYDGVDANGIPLHPGTGFTLGKAPTAPVVATSGAMYLYFSTNSSGVDSGFIATWTTERGPDVAPIADFVIPDTLYNPVSYTYKNTSKNVLGNTEFIWSIEPGYGEVGYTKDLDYTLFSDGNYDVTLETNTCMGHDKYTKSITVVTPHTKNAIDFSADNRRPNTGEIVNLSAFAANTSKAITTDQLKWTFFPNTVSYVGGTSSSDRDIRVTFNAKGKYTVSLRGYNSLDSASTSVSLIKSDYVIVVEHCTPILGVSSSNDIAINNVTLTDKNNKQLINNSSGNNAQGYDDYTNTVPAPSLLFGATYKLSLTRSTNVNPMSRRVWIDYNIDGDFEDAGELVLTENTATTINYVQNITIPSIKSAFEGKTKMRVGTSYSTDPNLPCGASSGVNNANRLGEFEDYRIILVNDLTAPVLSLINEDTLMLEVGSTYTEYGAKAIDQTEGDISKNIVITSDLDMGFTGIYYVTYNVTDAGGNDAIPVTRVVYVIKDQTKPVLTLNGKDTVYVEVFGTYTEDGATATDNRDGNLTNAIVIYGSVNTNVTGTYILKYLVNDGSGNSSTKNRVVIVRDSEKPVIVNTDANFKNEVKVQIMSVFIDRTKVTDNYDQPKLVETPGTLGPVDTRFKGSYAITYNATDASGNKADAKTYTYIVDDYVGPTIVLNTLDTIIHPVNTPYSPVQASVFDNYYDNTQVSLSRTSNVIFYKLGLYYDEFTAMDGSGNITVRRRYIRVVDQIAPVINGYPLNVGLYSNFDPAEGLVITDNYYAPSVLRPKLEVLFNNLNTYVEGIYAITYSLTDPSGNVSLPFNRIINVNRNYPTITGSVSTLANDMGINVYPNPSKGTVNVSYNFATPQNMDIMVYSSTGALVYSNNGINGLNGVQSIDLSNQANGLYHVRMVVAGKQINRTVNLSK
jgi:PKD repeat protein